MFLTVLVISQYLELERFREAEEAFRNATLLQPTHVLAWTNLIVMLDNIGMEYFSFPNIYS